MMVLITANLVNVAANWILVFGHLGAPALGVVGAGWATFISRLYMSGSLLLFIVYHGRRHRTGLLETPFGVEVSRFRRLLGLGFPAAVQITIEMGVFAAATVLAGKLDSASLAAHQIALTAASLSFMVPLGVSSAGAVRVGQAVGRRDPRAAALSGWTALLLGGGFMLLAAFVFFVAPRAIVRAFTTDTSVMAAGVSLLFVAAFFQLFDGIQVVATGIMRGIGDTKTPMVSNIVGHWLLGLPVGYFLCFVRGWGVVGLWIGLSIGLISVGAYLLLVWSRRVRSLHARMADPSRVWGAPHEASRA
jgi:MATE family multidrug resistance protein